MKTSHNVESCTQYQQGMGRVGIRVISLTVLFFCFSLTSAFGSSEYADMWMAIPSNPDNTLIVGCAVSDQPYYGYGHEYYVTTTITSEDGRTATGYGSNGSCGTGSECARADVALPFILNGEWVMGTYMLYSLYETYCPYYNMESEAKEIETPGWISASTAVFEKPADAGCDTTRLVQYPKVANCDVPCTGRGFITDFGCTRYVIYIEPYMQVGFGAHICLGFFGLDDKIRSDVLVPCRAY
jgi:hypothetical protein